MYYRCRFTDTESGSCYNQNFGKEYCFYHEGIVSGKFTPSKEKYSLSTLPSYSDGSMETTPGE